MLQGSEGIPNDNIQNYPFCRIKLVVETFEHPTLLTNQLSLQSCLSNEYKILLLNFGEY